MPETHLLKAAAILPVVQTILFLALQEMHKASFRISISLFRLRNPPHPVTGIRFLFWF